MARPRVERRCPQESQPAQHRVHLAAGAVAPGWPRHKHGRPTHARSSLLQRAPRRKARSWCSKKALQRSDQETACTCGYQSWQQETSDPEPDVSSRQRGKPQRKSAGGRRQKGERHPYHPHPKPSSVQSAVEGAHQESISTATNEHAKIYHQPSQQSPSARNEPSSSDLHRCQERRVLQTFHLSEP